MTRQSISLTEPNDNWLKEQLRQEEYSSKSELINDLIRKEREKQKEIEWLRLKLQEGEQSGFTNLTSNEILAQSKEQLRSNDKF